MLKINNEECASAKRLFPRDCLMLERSHARSAVASAVYQPRLERFRTALLGGAALLVLLGSGQVAHAQTVIDSGTVTVPGDHSSPWTLPDALIVGDTGTAELDIGLGGIAGTVNSDGGSVGRFGGANGVVTVNGSGSKWDTGSGALEIGVLGTGGVAVTGGASVVTGGTSLGREVSGVGTLVVTDPNSSWSGYLFVGTKGEGYVRIDDHATATATGDVQIGFQDTGYGELKVRNGGNFLATDHGIYVGANGYGVLSIESGGRVASKSSSIGVNAGFGSATIDGGGSRWDVTSNFNVGVLGAGYLTISNGGTLVTGSPAAHSDAYIGAGSSSTTTTEVSAATISGANSSWTAYGSLYVANYANAALAITDGGLVSVSDDAIIGNAAGMLGEVKLTGSDPQHQATWTVGSKLTAGNDGNAKLTLSNGILQSGSASLAVGANSITEIRLSDASSWSNAGSLTIGENGFATVYLQGGSTLQSGDTNIGQETNSGGILALTGPGTSWTSTGFVNIGNKGTGELLISNGAVATTTANSIAVGKLGDGTVAVTGAGSAWNTDVFAVGVSSGSTGLLTIEHGGTVASSGAIIGFQTGSSGVVNIEGAGSSWSVANGLTIGGDGSGDLTISNGGSLIVGTAGSHADAYIGEGSTLASSSVSFATVTGANSSWTTYGSLYVGNYANGELFIKNGGSVAVSDNLVLGYRPSAFGAVIVSGPGSNLSVGQSLFVGGASGASAGTGGFVISDGATVTVGNGAGIVNVGMGGSSNSILYIGDAGTPIPGSSTAAPGTLNAAEVFLGQNSEVVFSHTSSNYTFSPKFSGVGTIGQVNGTTILTADSSAFNGSTIVNGGTLIVDGTLGGSVDVDTGAALGGKGSLTGAVYVLAGGKLLGTQGETLTMGSLVLGSTSSINVALGAPGNSAGLFKVNGSLVLDGTLNVTDAGGFGAGVYRIFEYDGTLTDNGLAVGMIPNGMAGSVQTSVANQVNFVVGASNAQFWNGMTTTADGTVHGGSGTWIAGDTNWTDFNGSVASPWHGQFAVFQNNPGTVTVDNSAGAISTTQMQFIGQGWIVDGDALRLNGSGGSTTIRVGDGSAASASDYAVINTVLTGNSRLVKDDLGTLILSHDNTYTGGTWIKAGTLQFGDSGGAGSVMGDVQNDGRLVFARSDMSTFAGKITGSGSLGVDSGSVSLTSDNSYTGGTTIASGAMLQIGDGGTSGSIVGNIVNNGLLQFYRSDAVTFGGAMSGNGHFVSAGPLTLTGDSGAFTGSTTVALGTLQVNGKLGGVLTIVSGAALGGSGAVGDVTAASGSTLLGVQGQTLTMNSLALDAGSNINVALGTTGGAGVFKVNGNLVLDGTLNVTDAGGFGGGIYRVFDYGGTLTDNGLTVGTLPNGTNAAVQTTVANQVNLLVDAASTQFWNGTATIPDGNIHGGSGTWIAGSTNWTNLYGTISTSWGGQFAVFQNHPDKVTVDGSAGAISTTGMQFIGQGWSVEGDSMTLAGQNGDTSIRVGDGSATSASDHATIAAVLTGNSRLVKDDLGTLTLTADNTYSGGTWIKNGTLQLGNGAVNGSISGDVQNDGRLVIDRVPLSPTLTMTGKITGSGSLDVSTGTLLLTADNTYTGGTTIAQSAELDLGNGGTSGSITGNVVNNGYLTFKRSDAVTFGGAISGNGDNQILGSVTLTGNSGAFSGTTTVGFGTLQVNGTLGGATQVFANGTLGGTGTLTGPTTIMGGTLLGVQGQTLSTGTLTLSAGSNVNVALGAPGNSTGLFAVNGDLVLDGTLNVTDAGGFGLGVYRIFDYSGALTDNGMDVNAPLTGTMTADLQTAQAHQVNLIVADGTSTPVPTVQFWNGTTTVADGTIHGGSGVWSAGPATNWTDLNGNNAAAWGGNFAVFQSSPGTVTVDGSAGGVSTTGMQFIGQGWTVTGDAIALNGAGGSTTIRVGDGTAASASHTATIGSVLTGSSALVKDDLGTLILTADNTYSGGTTIKHGTLQIGDGNGGTTGSIMGNVVDDGLLRFARSDATTFAGAISGTGIVDVLVGDVTLTADNTYAGGTSISNGASLSVGNGGTTGSIGSGNIQVDGSLVFNRSNDLTIGGRMVGTGALRQIGSGKTELTGDNSLFTGATSVEHGTLAVNGKLGGTLDVWTGGRLQGVGTVGNTIVNGTIAPGNSIGTLHVASNITFNAGSIYEVEVNAAGQSDKIAATGAAAINGGSVKVLAGMGNYAPATTYTILTANGGRTGTFSGGVTSNLAFLDPSLSYDANNVYLTMTRNVVSFQNVGVTPNQIATGGGVESLGSGNTVYDAVLNLSAPQAQYAFDQLSGEIHASAKTALIEDSRFVRNAVNDRIRAAFDGVGASGTVTTYVDGKPVTVKATTDRLAVWGQGFGSWGHTDGDGNAATLNRKTGGFFLGADAPVFDTWRFGAVAGYSRTDFDVKSRHSSGASDNYHVGLYGGTAWADLAFRTGAAYTWHDLSTSRTVMFPGFGNSPKGDYNAATAQVFGELAYGFNAGGARFEPFANLAYLNLHTDGFTERGRAAALTSPSSNTDATFTTLGLRASTAFDIGGSTLTAKGMLGWRHAFGDVTPLSTMRFAGGGNAFSIGGVPIARDAAVIEAGLDYAITPNATLGVTYGGQFGSGMSDQSVKANFNVKF
jgi:fibronectin-binding autotransporter adhesin